MDQLLEIIGKFPGKRIGIIGDLMIDRYLVCEITRISPEAPIPVAKIIDETYVLGGAANVAANVGSLGGKAEILGLIGTDENGRLMKKMFGEQEIEYSLSLGVSNRPTTVKTRLVSGNQQIVRVDRESDKSISLHEEEEILRRLPAFLEKSEIIIISDYAKGFITDNIARRIIRLARERGIKVLSDPSNGSFEKFSNSYIVKPNKTQAESMSGMKLEEDYSNLMEVMQMLREKLNSHIIVTLGKDGLAILGKSGAEKISAVTRDVFDVAGAGDTVISSMALAIASGADLRQAAIIGNHAGGVVVSKKGTAFAQPKELIGSILGG